MAPASVGVTTRSTNKLVGIDAMTVKALAAAAIVAAVVLAGSLANSQPASPDREPDLAEGKRLFRADCAGCHKWHGGGGGGYGGAALSLRATRLDRDQIIITVGCGRPGTGMPYHLRDAHDDKQCYGRTRDELTKIKMMPIEAPNFLRPPEIAAITDYVLAKVKGRGEPTYAQCIEFFGEGSHVCNVYQQQGHEAGEQR